MTNKVNCPKCGNEFVLDDLLEQKILEKHKDAIAVSMKAQQDVVAHERKRLEQQQAEFEEKVRLAREDYKDKLAAHKQAITDEVKLKVHSDFKLKLDELERQLSEQDTKLLEAQKNELELLRKSKELAEQQKSLELEIEKRVERSLAVERNKIEEEAGKDVRKVVEEMKIKDAKIEEYQQTEIQFFKQKAELDAKMQELDLEVLRKLEEERQKVKADAIRAFEERHRFEKVENEKTICDLRKIIEDLQLKIEEKSQQKKGEVAELEIENLLKATFSNDLVEAVPKGVRGADVVQAVRNQFGQECGTIIIEAKRTKAWSQGWINKLKDDQREINADVALLITSVMPKESERFIFHDGVWVTDFETFMDLVTVLRMNLIEISRIRAVKDQKESKLNDIYQYVTGNDFRQKVSAVMDTLLQMKNDLVVEKTSIQRLWSKREKHIENIINATSRMSGDIEAILGTAAKEFADLKDTFPNTKPA